MRRNADKGEVNIEPGLGKVRMPKLRRSKEHLPGMNQSTPTSGRERAANRCSSWRAGDVQLSAKQMDVLALREGCIARRQAAVRPAP